MLLRFPRTRWTPWCSPPEDATSQRVSNDAKLCMASGSIMTTISYGALHLHGFRFVCPTTEFMEISDDSSSLTSATPPSPTSWTFGIPSSSSYTTSTLSSLLRQRWPTDHLSLHLKQRPFSLLCGVLYQLSVTRGGCEVGVAVLWVCIGLGLGNKFV